MVLGAGPMVFFHVVAGVLSSVYSVQTPSVNPHQFIQKERKRENARAFGTAGEGMPSKKARGSEGFELPARGSTLSDWAASSEKNMISLNQPAPGNFRPFEQAQPDSSQSLREGAGVRQSYEQPQNFQDPNRSSAPSFAPYHSGASSEGGSSGVSAKMKSKGLDSAESNELATLMNILENKTKKTDSVSVTSPNSPVTSPNSPVTSPNSPVVSVDQPVASASTPVVNSTAPVVNAPPPPPPPPAPGAPVPPPPPSAGNATQQPGMQGVFNQIIGGKQLKKATVAPTCGNTASATPQTPAEEMAQMFKAGRNPLGANRPKTVAPRTVQALSPQDEIVQNTAKIASLRNKIPGLQVKEVEARDAGKDSRSFKTQIANTLKEIQALESRNAYLDRTIRNASRPKNTAAAQAQGAQAAQGQVQAHGQLNKSNRLSENDERVLRVDVGNAAALFDLLSENGKYNLSKNRDLVEKLTLLTDAEIVQLSAQLGNEPASMRYNALRNEGVLFLMDVAARKAAIVPLAPSRDDAEIAALMSDATGQGVAPPPPPAEEEENQQVANIGAVQGNVIVPPAPSRDDAEIAALMSDATGQGVAPPPPPAEEEENQQVANQVGAVQGNVIEPVAEPVVIYAPISSAPPPPPPPPPPSGFANLFGNIVGQVTSLIGFNQPKAAEPMGNGEPQIQPQVQVQHQVQPQPQGGGGLLDGIINFTGLKKAPVVEKKKVTTDNEEQTGFWGGFAKHVKNFLNSSPAKTPGKAQIMEDNSDNDDEWGDEDTTPVRAKKAEAEIQAELRAEEADRAARNAEALKILEAQRAQKAEEERIEAENKRRADAVVAEPVIETFDWGDEDEVAFSVPTAPPPPGSDGGTNADATSQAAADEQAQEGTPLGKKPEAKKKEDSPKKSADEEAENKKGALAAALAQRRIGIHRHDEDDAYSSDDE